MSSQVKKLILELESKQAAYRAKAEEAHPPSMADYYNAVATGIGIAIQEAIREATL